MEKDENYSKLWDEIGYIISSKIRLRILIYLANEPSTPSQISEKLSIPISQVSIALRELSTIGVVKCLTPNRKKGRLYAATDKGKNILAKIHEITNISRSP